MVRRAILPSLLFATTALGCAVGDGPQAAASDEDASDLELAESFVSAFYSWDEGALQAVVGDAEGADNAWYYQKWAVGAHYAIEERPPCRSDAPGEVSCSITVTDDFGKALGYTATDTFFLSIDTLADEGPRITGVRFEGDDPPVFGELFAWMEVAQPEILIGPCRDMFDGGETPVRCAEAVAAAAREFAARVDPAASAPSATENPEEAE